MSLQPFTLFSFNISACGFVLVGPKIIILDRILLKTGPSFIFELQYSIV